MSLEAKLLQELIDKVDRLDKKVDGLRTESVDQSLEMIPIGRVCKLLKKGYETVVKLVESGELEAVRFKIGKVERLMFRVADIREFQERGKGNVLRPANDFKSYFNELRSKVLAGS